MYHCLYNVFHIVDCEASGVVVKNNLSMQEAMEQIKNGASYLGEKEMLQYMDIETWNANCEMVEKEVR